MITVSDIMSWTPREGYPRERVERLVGGGITPAQVLDLDIPAEDRLWVVLRPEVLDERTLRLVACWCASRGMPLYECAYPGDTRPRRAVATAERYARGHASGEDMAAAAGASWAAADSAAIAAVDVTTKAARAAANAAAWGAEAAAWAAAIAADAATRAARAASWSAANAAAWGAVDDIRVAQIECLRAILDGSLDTTLPVNEWPTFGWPEVKA